ncbi:MAG: type II secretion system protein N [Pseudomonadales bacterium]
MNDVAAKLALPVRWLVVAGIAYTLATTVLYLLSAPATAPQSAAGSALRAQPQATAGVDLNAILASNLFGAAGARAPQATAVVTPTVATQLPLDLLGVFVADTTDNSAAIISQRGRPGMLYSVGSEVPGSARLVEVHASHVVLRRAGVHETLHFPTGSAALAARANTQPSLPEPMPDQGLEDFYPEPPPEEEFYFEDPIDEDTAEMQDQAMTEPQSARQLLDEYRERLEEEPLQTLEEIGVSVVNEGAAEGYRIGNLAHSPHLSHTGLQPGDVVLSVNGRPVGDPNQDRAEMASVLAQGSARLEIQRGTRRFFVTASLQE